MKVIKVIVAILVCLLLIAAEGMAMGIFSVDRALSEDTIKKSITESKVVDDVVNEALKDSTVSMGGAYGDLIKSAMKTDAMSGFLAAYLTSAVRSEIYGEQYEEIGQDDLMQAFSSAIDEMEDSGAIDISAQEESLIKELINRELPDLTANLNSIVSQYDALDDEVLNDATSQAEASKSLLSRHAQIVMILISAALCLVLIALFWRSKAGFLWSAIVTGLVTGIYVILTLVGASGTLTAELSTADAFVLSLLSNGFRDAAIAGGIATCAFIAAYIIFKANNRRQRRA